MIGCRQHHARRDDAGRDTAWQSRIASPCIARACISPRCAHAAVRLPWRARFVRPSWHRNALKAACVFGASTREIVGHVLGVRGRRALLRLCTQLYLCVDCGTGRWSRGAMALLLGARARDNGRGGVGTTLVRVCDLLCSCVSCKRVQHRVCWALCVHSVCVVCECVCGSCTLTFGLRSGWSLVDLKAYARFQVAAD